MLCQAMVTILVHFGPFWFISWATPGPFSIEFSLSHQRYVSYALRALKRATRSEDIDQTWAISMGKSGQKLPSPTMQEKIDFSQKPPLEIFH